MVLWHLGILASWQLGILAYWHLVILASWHLGILASWHLGFLASWHLGIFSFWNLGILAFTRWPDSGIIRNLRHNPSLLKGIDIKDFVEIVILRYDHWPQFFSHNVCSLGKWPIIFIIFKYLKKKVAFYFKVKVAFIERKLDISCSA